jgi:outer membrane lipoprotein SlyB
MGNHLAKEFSMNAMHPSGLPTGNVLAASAPKTHPLILVASMAVIFASATAVASMFGLIGPSASQSSKTQANQLSSAIAPVSTAVAATTAPEVASAPILLAPSASKTIQVPASVIEPEAKEPSARLTPRPVARPNPAPLQQVQRPVAINQGASNPVNQSAPISQSPQVIAQNQVPPIQESAPSYPANSQNYPVNNAPVIASAPTPDYRSTPVQTAQAQYVDPNIGTVTSIREDQRKGQGSGVGAMAGGAVGGALGNQMSKGNGRIAATILGAIGGGLIGNEIEKSQRVVTTYVATVRMPDGAVRNFNFATRPALSVGDSFDVRTAPSGSQAQYVKPRKLSPPDAVRNDSMRQDSMRNDSIRSDSMRSDNPYNT